MYELLLLFASLQVYSTVALNCAVCEYVQTSDIKDVRTCNNTCEGNLCYIVVNMYHNATLIAGCLDVDAETLQQFQSQSLCQRKAEYTACGCASFDRCNSPQAPSSGFRFVETAIFNGHALMPAAAVEGDHPGASSGSAEVLSYTEERNITPAPGESQSEGRSTLREASDSSVPKDEPTKDYEAQIALSNASQPGDSEATAKQQTTVSDAYSPSGTDDASRSYQGTSVTAATAQEKGIEIGSATNAKEDEEMYSTVTAAPTTVSAAPEGAVEQAPIVTMLPSLDDSRSTQTDHLDSRGPTESDESIAEEVAFSNVSNTVDIAVESPKVTEGTAKDLSRGASQSWNSFFSTEPKEAEAKSTANDTRGPGGGSREGSPHQETFDKSQLGTLNSTQQQQQQQTETQNNAASLVQWSCVAAAAVLLMSTL